MRAALLSWSFLLLMPVMASAAESAVPLAYQGHWGKGGDCHTPSAQLVIGAKEAALATAPPAQIVFYKDDQAEGMDGLHWRIEGSVDNFVLDSKTGALLHNLEGYGTGQKEAYRRCR